jgi:hypothetical protein
VGNPRGYKAYGRREKGWKRKRINRSRQKGSAKAKVALGKSVGRRFPILGAGIGANDIANSYTKEGGFGPETKETTAGVAGGVGGGYAGGKIGAVIGGVVGGIILPGAGVGPGAVVGGIIGGGTGSYAGSELSKSAVRASQRRRCK